MLVQWEFAGSPLGVQWESAGSLLGVCWESAGSLLGIFKMVSLEGSTNELSKLRPVRSLLRVLLKSAECPLGVHWKSACSLKILKILTNK